MKLYYHPVSTTSRPVLLLAADEGIALDHEVVDLFTGAHLQPAFASINPSQQVPVLKDGEFRLSESSAILKYLAEKTGSAAYPKDLQKRARINEVMDWFNTGLYRDLGYGLVYPQVLPNYKREDAALQKANYLGIGMLSAGEVARLDYAQWKNLSRWIATMKARPTWDQVNEGFYTYFVAPYKDAAFEGLRGQP